MELTRVRARGSKVDRAGDAIPSHGNVRDPPQVDGNVSVSRSIGHQLLHTGRIRRHKLDEGRLEGQGGRARASRSEGQRVVKIEQAHALSALRETGDERIVVLACRLGLEHLERVAVVARLEGGRDLDQTIGRSCGQDLEGPVLVGDLGQGGAHKVHGHNQVRLHGGQAGIEGHIRRGATEASQGQGLVRGIQAVQEVIRGSQVGLKCSDGHDKIVAGDQAEVLDSRDTHISTSGGSAEGDIAELQAQVRGVLEVDNRGHDNLVGGVEVGVDENHELHAVQVVQTLEGSVDLEADAGDGQVAKDAEVQFGIHRALEGGNVRSRRGEGTDEP